MPSRLNLILVGSGIATFVAVFVMVRTSGSESAVFPVDDRVKASSTVSPVPDILDTPPDHTKLADPSVAPAATYTHPDLGFSFDHPSGATVNTFSDGTGDVVTVETSHSRGVQIYILPFDEPGPLTVSRLRRDLPHLRIDAPQEVRIGAKNDIPALRFLSSHPDFPRPTIEFWFVHDDYLYQVASFDAPALLDTAEATWTFDLE